MATIGQTLAAARQAAGHTIADLSTRTRIREPVLRGIEEEDFVPCGGDFYARGHIRSLCRTLGVEPGPLLEEYDREHAANGHPAFVPPPRDPAAASRASRAAALVRKTVRAGGGAPETEGTETAAAETADGKAAGPQRFGEDTDPGADAERWGHFERGQNLSGRVRKNRPRAVVKAFLSRHDKEGGGHASKHRKPAADEKTAGTGTTAGTETAAAAETKKPEKHAKREPRPAVTRTRTRRREAVSRHWPWLVVALILALTVIVGIRAWNGDGTSPLRTALESVRGGEQTVGSSVLPEEADEEIDVDQVSGESAGQERAEGEKNAVDEARGGSRPEVTVGLAASDRSWVKVTDSSGEDLFTGFLVEGEDRDYVTDDDVTLWLGDAGAITVSVDGENIGPAGFSGEVREITVGAEGFGE